jgi:DNA polymerase-3 subunit beta
VQLVITPSHAFFRRVDSTLGIKLIDVQFPPYNQVIPSSSAHTVRLSKGPFSESIRAVAIAVSDKAGTIRLRLEPNRLSIRSENPDSGDAADEIAIDYSGPDIAIGFNAKYLLDALSAVDENEVQLGVSGQLDPVVIEGATDRTVLGIVMPMRI